MYISQLVVQGFRGFSGPREVALDFSRPDGTYAGWTVLAGRNGSGKTTFLQAIALGIVGDYFIRGWDVWSGRRTGEQALIAVTVVQDSNFDSGLDFGPQVFELRWDDEGHPYVPPRSAGSRGRGKTSGHSASARARAGSSRVTGRSAGSRRMRSGAENRLAP